MAGHKKRNIVHNENRKSSDGESENEDIYTGQEVIQADFEGRNPEPSDFHGIKQLLKQLFLKAHIDLSQLSDMLVSQNTVGSVLKQSDDNPEDSDEDEMDINDVFGITSVINITSKKSVDCVEQLRSLLKELAEKHASAEDYDKIVEILEHKPKDVGLLINERFVNIPAQIADPLFASLCGEIQKAKSNKMPFDFGYYILICKLYKQEAKDDGVIPETIFSNPEEELFDSEAEIKFEFSVKNESDSGVSGHWLEDDQTMVPYRRVLLFPAEKLQPIIEKIKNYVKTD